MNEEQNLKQELDAVASRYRRFARHGALAACWVLLAVAGVALLARAPAVSASA